MAPTPGGGVSLQRLALVSSAALGTGLTDAVFIIFILQTLIKVGASRILAFLPLAVGSAIAIVAAPTATVLSKTHNRRVRIAFTLLYVGSAASIALAFVFSRFTESQNRLNPVRRKWMGIFLATVYRASIQSSPYVPTVMSAARVHGTESEYPFRSDLGTSLVYLAYRVGFVTSSIFIAILPDRMLTSLFPILITASAVSVVLITIGFIAMPREDESASASSAALPAMADEPVPFRAMVREHLNAGLLRADKRLIATYVETFCYGLAFGQLGVVTASFFSDEVFKGAPGNPDGLRWAAFSVLIGRGISLVLDASLPMLVFRRNASKFNMSAAWVGGALVGSAIFAALKFTKQQVTALVLFGTLAVTTSTHGLFSVLAVGALVEPKYRSTSFGCRAASMSAGILFGAIGGGIVAESTNGFEWVMVWSSVTTLLSAMAAGFCGVLTPTDFEGVAANANPLFSYVFRKR